MFDQGFRPRLLRMMVGESHTRRVFELYLKCHRDELLGFGYHQFICMGRGAVVLSCRYRDLFFGKGFFPKNQYLSLRALSENKLSGELDLSNCLTGYNPETEIVVYLQVQKSDRYCLSRLSKKGLALNRLHRKYLNRLLDYVAVPGITSS